MTGCTVKTVESDEMSQEMKDIKMWGMLMSNQLSELSCNFSLKTGNFLQWMVL